MNDIETLKSIAATDQPILVSFESDYLWMIEVPIRTEQEVAGFTYEHAIFHVELQREQSPKTIEQTMGMSFRAKTRAVQEARWLAQETGLKLKILPLDKILRYPKTLKPPSAIDVVLQKTTTQTIVIINAWWAPGGIHTVWGNKSGKSTKISLNDNEQKAVRKLGRQGVLVETLVTYDNEGRWQHRIINRAPIGTSSL